MSFHQTAGLEVHVSGFHYGKEEDHSATYLKSIMGFLCLMNLFP